jgi:RsiW-degrading membrane proteinase PrsW (M82 family)
MQIILTACSAILPALLLLWFFSSRDRFPEPPKAIWTTFVLGVLTIIPAALIELALERAGYGLSGLSSAVFKAFVVAAAVEELFKLSVLQAYSFRSRYFNETMDGIVYGAASGLGFATLENILYVLGPGGGIGVSALRAILSVPGHALWGAVLGFYAGSGRLCGRPVTGSLKGLAAAIALHGTYDVPVMLISSSPGTIDTGLGILLIMVMLGVSAAGWVWVIRLCRRLRKEQLVVAADHSPVGDSSPAMSDSETRAARQALLPGVGPRCGHPGATRFAGYLLVTMAALLLTWAVIVAVAMASMDRGVGESAEGLLFGGLIVGGLPASIGLVLLFNGIRKLKRLRVES